MNTSVDKVDITELEARFTTLNEKEDSKDFLAGLIDYLRFIEDTPAIKTVARKIMTNKPSFAISAMAQLYKGLQKVWEENYSPIETVWADMHSPMAGGKSKYGLPMSFGDLQYSRSTTRVFHNQLLYEIDQTSKEIYLESFDRERGILIIGGTKIVLGKKAGSENNQIRLLATLLKDPARYWANDELTEDWEGVNSDQVGVPTRRFYDTAKELNTTVRLDTGVTDFMDYTLKQVRINPSYLKEM